MKTVKLSFITDEATQDLKEAIALAQEHGMSGVELRSVENTPIDQIPMERLKEYKQWLDAAGLKVCNLASSFFKCLPREAGGEIDKLRRLCDAADILECRTIRGFVFFADENGPEVTDEMVTLFTPAVDMLQARGKQLLIEADPSVNTTNHAAVAAFLERLNSHAVGAIYDPGNDIFDPGREVPYPDGYEAVKKWVRHVHIKDAIRDENGAPRCVCVGTGWVDYPGLVRALCRDGYDGWMSLETHYRVNAAISDALMARPGGTAFSEGGMGATVESAEALRAIIREALQ